MADSIRDLIADVLRHVDNDAPYEVMADAILAHPDIRAIIDLAWWVENSDPALEPPKLTPEVRALLADWRQG